MNFQLSRLCLAPSSPVIGNVRVGIVPTVHKQKAQSLSLMVTVKNSPRPHAHGRHLRSSVDLTIVYSL